MQPDELKATRELLGLSQQAVADAIGISQSHYCRLERGAISKALSPTALAVSTFFKKKLNARKRRAKRKAETA